MKTCRRESTPNRRCAEHLYDRLLEKKSIVRAPDVRAALAYVERGEASAGVVYATDAMISTGVEIAFTFPAATHDPIRYPLLLLKRAEANPAAKRFFDFLGSREAAAIFAQHGFEPLN